MATAHVRNYGNNGWPGTSAQPKRTLNGAYSIVPAQVDNIIYARGYFNEAITPERQLLEGIGNCVIDGYGFGNLVSSFQRMQAKNITFTGWTNLFRPYNVNYILGVYGCILKNNSLIGRTWYNDDRYGLGSNPFEGNLVHNNGTIYLQTANGGTVKDNTFHKTTVKIASESYVSSESAVKDRNIFSNLSVQNTGGIDINWEYSLFVNCSFKFKGEASAAYPTGATDADKLNNLRQRMAAANGGSPENYFRGCKYYSGSYNDIFVDADNGDFNLVPNCLPAHMSYQGDYIGARPEGVAAKIGIDFTTRTNIDTSGNIIDQNTDAIAITDIQRIGHARKIKSLNLLQQLAKRNGQSANIDNDLGPDIAAGPSVLEAGKLYQAHNDLAIIYNAASTSLNPFQTYLAVDEGGGAGLGFSGNGVMKEVLIDKYPEKIQLKVSTDDGTLASANLITCYVHRSSAYVMVNYDGTGKPLYGDADANYNPNNAEVLVADWWKAYITIKANNLTAAR